MKSSRFSQERIIGILKQGEAGVKVTDLCRQHGISDHTLRLRSGQALLSLEVQIRGHGGLGGREAESSGRGEPPAQTVAGGERAGQPGLEDGPIKKILTRPQQREAVSAMQTVGVSQRQACSLLGIWRGPDYIGVAIKSRAIGKRL